ncbi:MAG: SPFH domain-containing protein [Pirellulales bacterium]
MFTNAGEGLLIWGALDGGAGAWAGFTLIALLAAALIVAVVTVRFIPNNRVGVVEKLWSKNGSVSEGRILALEGEAGYQTNLLRGGLHWGYWRWQYRIHKTSLVTIPQGKIGYVYARDGEPLSPAQTLARIVDCNHFQDAEAFLGMSSPESARGQRGRQLAILREGVYAINPALFVVMTEDAIYALPSLLSRQEAETVKGWHAEMVERNGFAAVVIGQLLPTSDPLHPEQTIEVDGIGIVTVHDGPSLPPGEIIAPPVGEQPGLVSYHNNFQSPAAFLEAGGRRGRQFQTLTDGTYFINRWFATVEHLPKTVVPIGYVGVVVSYFGRDGQDVSGETFRHGERVAEGNRGVWQRPLGPGKYAFNTYAGNIALVPTTNFVLHWVTGKSESHRYDESLRSIELVTRDAYEPRLPLSVVVHIDYQRAPNVIQRFGDVKKLITQTLDPLLSAYFRDIAHKKTMLELLHDRDRIQAEAREELRRKFHDFDIECVDVLIGKPDTDAKDDKIESLLEQLRTRQLSFEQLETYERQRAAAEKKRELHEAQALAEMQTQLTNTRVRAQIAESEGAAELARAKKLAEKQVVMADADLAQSRRKAEQTVVLAEADSRREVLAGQGAAQRVMQVGLSEAAVLMRKISSYGDPRLYALEQTAAQLSQSSQPLVPERVFVSGGVGGGGTEGGVNETSTATLHGLAGMLLQLMVAERTAFQPATSAELDSLREYTERATRDALALLQAKTPSGSSPLTS